MWAQPDVLWGMGLCETGWLVHWQYRLPVTASGCQLAKG